MGIFDVFSMNGIENAILKVSQTHFSKDFYPKGGGGGQCPLLALPREGGIHFSRGGCEVPGVVPEQPIRNSQ